MLAHKYDKKSKHLRTAIQTGLHTKLFVTSSISLPTLLTTHTIGSSYAQLLKVPQTYHSRQHLYALAHAGLSTYNVLLFLATSCYLSRSTPSTYTFGKASDCPSWRQHFLAATLEPPVPALITPHRQAFICLQVCLAIWSDCYLKPRIFQLTSTPSTLHRPWHSKRSQLILRHE